ncbi:InlB B-repeat-containing protein [Bacillus taeanensis]|nr:tetratricopeptide repeat protein [Bacillus taeanensis]
MDKKYILLIFVGIIVIGLMGVLTVHAIQSDNISAQYEKAAELFEEEDIEKSIEAYQNVLEIDPLHLEARLGLAEAYTALSQFKEAETVLKEGIKLAPEDPTFYLSLSTLYVKLSHVTSALKILDLGMTQSNGSELQTKYSEIEENIKISSERLLVQKGYEHKLSLVLEQEGALIPMKAEWELEDESIGTLEVIDEGQAVTFLGKESGEVKITAKSGSISREIVLKVQEHVLESMSVTPEELEPLAIDQSLTLTVTGQDAAGEEMTFTPTWTLEKKLGDLSANEGTESSFTARKEGKEIITISYEEFETEVEVLIEGDSRTVTTEVTGEGTVLLSPEQDSYPLNSVVTLTAQPQEGWKFVRWEGDIYGTNNPGTVKVTDHMAIHAVFERIGHTLSLSSSGEGQILRSSLDTTFSHNESIVLTARAAEGWKFERWEGTVSGTAAQITVVMDNNQSLRAVFTKVEEEAQPEPDPDSYLLSVSKTGEGTVSKSRSGSSFPAGTQVTVSASPSAGWKFVRWEGDVSGTSSSAVVTMNGNRSVRAVFAKKAPEIKQYTLSTLVVGSGSISRSSGGSTFPEGTTVTLTANPADGWTFVRWVGASSSSSATTSVTMDGNKSVSAVFEKVVEEEPVNSEPEETDENSETNE